MPKKRKRVRESEKFKDPAINKRKFKHPAMLGRKISLEDRGPDAKKLGRRFDYAEGESEKRVVTLLLKRGSLKKLLGKSKAKSLARAIADLIERAVA